VFHGTAGEGDQEGEGRDGGEKKEHGDDEDVEGTATVHGFQGAADLELETEVVGVESGAERSWSGSIDTGLGVLVAARVIAAALVLVDADDTVAANLPLGVNAPSSAPLDVSGCVSASVGWEDTTNGEEEVLGGLLEGRGSGEVGVRRARGCSDFGLQSWGGESLLAAPAGGDGVDGVDAVSVGLAGASVLLALDTIDSAALLRVGVEDVSIIAALPSRDDIQGVDAEAELGDGNVGGSAGGIGDGDEVGVLLGEPGSHAASKSALKSGETRVVIGEGDVGAIRCAIRVDADSIDDLLVGVVARAGLRSVSDDGNLGEELLEVDEGKIGPRVED